MRLNKATYPILAGILLALITNGVMAQKPFIIGDANALDSSWMTREIPAKKLAKKKYTLKRRLYQNLITRFNSYYNARTKLAAILERAARDHRNDYDSLLGLFPYSPGDLRPMAGNLDSVIFDAGYGIEIHDPRSKWMDNLYLIAGKAYYFKQDYRNAIAAFKYIIKHYAPKDKEGNPLVIGSRGYTPQEQISVATPEKKKLFYHRPSRNDAFIWLIRCYIDSGSYDQAGSLISTLKADPSFPQRLQLHLAAMETLLYFRQQRYAKGIPFLEKASALQENKQLKARWEYLLGQLYEDAGNLGAAVSHYRRVTNLPTDPMMRFYAYLNMTELHILQDKENFATGSRLLLTMARKEKYDRYRSIIFYSLARMALRFGLPDQAIPYLQESLRHNPENTAQKSISLRLLADTYYNTGKYRPAKTYYDSAVMLIPPGQPGNGLVTTRRDALGTVVGQLDIIGRQDSLQRLAAMPRDELHAYLEQIVKDSAKARRKRNLIIGKPAIQGENRAGTGKNGQAAGNRNPSGASRTWYFYNPALRAKGFSLFKSRWGKRPLADNWRLGNASGRNQAVTLHKTAGNLPDFAEQASGRANETTGIGSLLAKIPLTPEQKKASNDSIIQAMYRESDVFADKLDNDTASLRIINDLMTRFPNDSLPAGIYYRLGLLYARAGNTAKAAGYRQMLSEKYPGSQYADMLSGRPEKTAPAMQRLTTGLYNSAYLAYLAGDYSRAAVLKDSAMRLDPQNSNKARFDLLGAMVLIKQQSDSAGKAALQHVIAADKKDTAIVAQAGAILDALDHKQELIEHLAHLQLPEEARQGPPVTAAAESRPPLPAKPPRDTAHALPAPAVPATVAPVTPPAKDTVAARAPAVKTPPAPSTPYKLQANEPHFVVLAFNRTDKKLIGECLQKFAAYNREKHLKDSIEVSSYLLGHNRVVLIFRLFPGEAPALLYYREMKEQAPRVIIPRVPRTYYRFFIISRDNFILLNSTKDYQGYLQFFSKNYR